MFAAWSRVRRSKQPAAYAGRAYGSEQPQVTAHSAHPAGMMRVDDSDCGPEGSWAGCVGQQMGSNRCS